MYEERFIKVFARNLKTYMDELDMSQRDLANALEVNESTVHCWLHGKAVPRMDKIEKLCKLFNCSRNDLITNTILPDYCIEVKGSRTLHVLVEQINPNHEQAVIAYLTKILELQKEEDKIYTEKPSDK